MRWIAACKSAECEYRLATIGKANARYERVEHRQRSSTRCSRLFVGLSAAAAQRQLRVVARGPRERPSARSGGRAASDAANLLGRCAAASQRCRRLLRSLSARVKLSMPQTFTCSFELDKEKGVTIKLQNEGGKVVQTIVMDGCSTVSTVKGDKKTSTVVQKEGSVSIVVKSDSETSSYEQTDTQIKAKVKSFLVEAETVSLKSDKDTTFTADGKMTLKSTKDLAATSSAKADLQSTGAMSIKSSAGMTVAATANLSLSGQNSELKAAQKAVMDGTAGVEVSGLKVDVKGDTQVKLSGLTAELSGTTTTVKGSMVQVQGLVKLG